MVSFIHLRANYFNLQTHVLNSVLCFSLVARGNVYRRTSWITGKFFLPVYRLRNDLYYVEWDVKLYYTYTICTIQPKTLKRFPKWKKWGFQLLI